MKFLQKWVCGGLMSELMQAFLLAADTKLIG
jgi:hypothetical protein